MSSSTANLSAFVLLSCFLLVLSDHSSNFGCQDCSFLPNLPNVLPRLTRNQVNYIFKGWSKEFYKGYASAFGERRDDDGELDLEKKTEKENHFIPLGWGPGGRRMTKDGQTGKKYYFKRKPGCSQFINTGWGPGGRKQSNAKDDAPCT